MATCVRQKKGYFWLVSGVNQRKVLIIWLFKDKVKLYKGFREKFFFDLSSPLNKSQQDKISFQNGIPIGKIGTKCIGTKWNNCNTVYIYM